MWHQKCSNRYCLFQSTTIALEEAKDSLVALSSYQEEKVALARELERTLLGREKERRRDHDRLQELKGNIRVFCRVRPALSKYMDRACLVEY